jgi:hypothetical protein
LPRFLLAIVAAALATLALLPAASASAAVRSGIDRDSGVRVRLDGRAATITLDPHYTRIGFDGRPVRLSAGERVDVACGTSFREEAMMRGAAFVSATKRWPAGGGGLRFRFRRDLSAAVRWCVVEVGAGEDLGFVSFHRAEPRRRLAGGRGPDGRAWSLAAWRGDKLQPCARLRIGRRGYAERCFDDQAERDARVDVDFIAEGCSGDSYVLGVAPRSAVRVELVLSDGSRLAARVLGRPRGSRARATWFVLPLPSIAQLRAIEAFDAAGTMVGSEDLGDDGPIVLC